MRERYMEGWLMEDEKVREKQHKTGSRKRKEKKGERELGDCEVREDDTLMVACTGIFLLYLNQDGQCQV
jgi:hypothetical protein